MLKLSVLVLMVLQTTALVLLLRYSRIQPTEGRPRYLNTTAVFLAELLKMFVCILLVARENGAYISTVHIFVLFYVYFTLILISHRVFYAIIYQALQSDLHFFT